jgi:polysaccharide biosynthesis protein PslG
LGGPEALACRIDPGLEPPSRVNWMSVPTRRVDRSHITRQPLSHLRATAIAALGLASLALVACGAGSNSDAKALATRGASPVASIQDDRLYQDGADVPGRIRRMADLGARVIRVDMRWDLIATARPAAPRKPGDPAYNWKNYDAIVDAARANNVELLFTVWGTPAWAADPKVPVSDGFPAWAIRPLRPDDLGDFGEAAAARYASRGVHRWEAWNEPNIPLFLRPQYEKQGSKWVATSPEFYSRLLSSFYAAVKSVDASAVIAGGVTAPVGDTCPTQCPDSVVDRVSPVDFITALGAEGLRPPMDVVSHHPYPITPPRESTFAAASYIDLYNLNRLERTIDRGYLKDKKLWLTEFGFSTEPVPFYPTSFSRREQAAFLVDAYRRVRADARIDLLTWYILQDNKDWRSGLLTQAGRPKPAVHAFTLPFAAVSARVARGGRAQLVGQVRAANGATRVEVQRRSGGKWITVRRLRTTADGSFSLSLPVSRTRALRARWRGTLPSGTPATRISPTTVVRVR